MVGLWRGHIQQSNVLRAAQALRILEGCPSSGAGFDAVEIFMPGGQKVARIAGHRNVPGPPVNLGNGRPALHKLLADTAFALGDRSGLTPFAAKLAKILLNMPMRLQRKNLS